MILGLSLIWQIEWNSSLVKLGLGGLERCRILPHYCQISSSSCIGRWCVMDSMKQIIYSRGCNKNQEKSWNLSPRDEEKARQRLREDIFTTMRG